MRRKTNMHATSSHTVYDDTRNAEVNGSSSNATNGQILKDVSDQFKEFRLKKTAHWPEKTQNDAAEFLVDSENLQEGRKIRRRKRRRRRRKGKGRRRQRGRKGERGQTKDEGTEGQRVFQGSNQYYDKIHLFGLLDKDNATDTMT